MNISTDGFAHLCYGILASFGADPNPNTYARHGTVDHPRRHRSVPRKFCYSEHSWEPTGIRGALVVRPRGVSSLQLTADTIRGRGWVNRGAEEDYFRLHDSGCPG